MGCSRVHGRWYFFLKNVTVPIILIKRATPCMEQSGNDSAVSATAVPISQKKQLRLRVVKRLAHHVCKGTEFRGRWSDFILTHFKE